MRAFIHRNGEKMDETALQETHQQPKPPTPREVAATVEVGDTVRMRKPHPCGGFDWVVLRLGADIGLRCVGCERRVMLPRPEFERRMKKIVTRAADSPAPDLVAIAAAESDAEWRALVARATTGSIPFAARKQKPAVRKKRP